MAHSAAKFGRLLSGLAAAVDGRLAQRAAAAACRRGAELNATDTIAGTAEVRADAYSSTGLANSVTRCILMPVTC